MNLQLLEKLWSKTTIDLNTKCWLYQGYKDKEGYGSTTFNNRFARINRLSLYLYLNLKLDDIWQANHICNNRACWNPLHLYEGTHSENMYDSIRKGTHKNSRVGICKNGHPFTKENTRYEFGKAWKRHCITCDKERTKRYNALKKKKSSIQI